MATRDDMLIELGLAPVWQRRRTLEATIPAGIAASETGQPLMPRARASGTPVLGAEEDSGARSVRIAALEGDALTTDIAACTACGLCRTRTRTVPGVGDVTADWLFVGEAPGADEDAQGEPFVGQAGKLLDAMLGALGIARGANVYIANVLKCRPPANRAPEPHEVEACKPYLDRQIALIKPKLIVALGKCAATTLLGAESSIASLRGRVHRYGEIPMVVTYHPAYLLRSLPDKAKAWEDLLLARRTVEAGRRGETLVGRGND